MRNYSDPTRKNHIVPKKLYINLNEINVQLTEEELLELPEGVLRRLSVKLLYDLKEVAGAVEANIAE